MGIRVRMGPLSVGSGGARIGGGIGPVGGSVRLGGRRRRRSSSGGGGILGGLIALAIVAYLAIHFWFVVVPVVVVAGVIAAIVAGGKRRAVREAERAASERERSEQLIRAAAADYGRGVATGEHFTLASGRQTVALTNYRGMILAVYEVGGTGLAPLPESMWSDSISEETERKHLAARQELAAAEARQAAAKAAYDADVQGHVDRLARQYDGSARLLTVDDGTSDGLEYIVVTVSAATRAVFRIDRDGPWHIRKVTRVTRPYWPAELVK